MNDLIQTIKILESNELKIINDYIDTLKFEDCKVFGAHGENHVNPNMRSSSGTSMPENETGFIGGHPIVGDKPNTVANLKLIEFSCSNNDFSTLTFSIAYLEIGFNSDFSSQ